MRYDNRARLTALLLACAAVLLLPTSSSFNIAAATSIHVPDENTWRTPPIRPQGFQFEIQISSLGACYDREKVEASILGHALGEFDSAIAKTMAAEWGYSFTHLDGQRDGAGLDIQAGYPTPPAQRADCLPVIEAFLHRQYIRGAPHPWASMNGHFPWHHYAAEFGFDQIGSEIGENINNYQWHIALTRGAARQYARPWFIDFSAWHGPGINDYSGCNIWGEYSHPDHGHSMSLFERSLYASYMAGAGQITLQAGGALAFLPTIGQDGHYALSPMGEVCKRFHQFTRANPDIGIPYTPFAILLDRYHGAYPGFGKRKAFWHFDYTPGDQMTWDLIDLIWPGGWEVMDKSEVGTLVNGPLGDTFDILLQNAPQAVLNSYPCLLLSGEIQLTPEEANRITNYVDQGGTLLLNTAYLSQFPQYAQQATPPIRRATLHPGHGRVEVFGPDHDTKELPAILHHELDNRLPFNLTGDLQYLVNAAQDTLYITLTNNAGITKAPRHKPKIDTSQSRTATMTWKDKAPPISIVDIKNNTNHPPNRKITLTLPPGETSILRIKIR